MNLDINQIKELVKLAKMFKPIISESADDLLDAYGPELNKVVSRLRSAVVTETDAAIKQYLSLGYTKEEAILLVLNSKEALTAALRKRK